MNINEIREITFATNFIEGKTVKAAIYARVSTEKKEQKDSCENQLYLADAFIKNHPNVEVMARLVDDGISGKNAICRPAFQELIRLIEKKSIDLIIVKSRSRLHRDDETAVIFRNLCIENEVSIFVLDKNKISDYDDDNSALIESIEDSFDAQYVKRQSRYGKMTHQIRCEKKELSSKDTCFGYDWHPDTKTITVNEAEAEVVKTIFDMYVFEQKKPADIAKSLREEGVENRFSKVQFNSGTINRIIKNEKYLGNFYINRRYSKLGTGMNRKSKRITIPKDEWVLCERPDLRIIDDELFNLTQRLHASRQTIYNTNDYHITRQKFEGKHLFAGKIKCGCCGKSFHFGYSDRAETKAIYRIGSHSDCESPYSRIEENLVREIVITSIRTMLKTQEEAIKRVEDLLLKNIQEIKNEDELKRIARDIDLYKKDLEKYSLPLTDPDVLANKQLKDHFLFKVKETQNCIDTLEAKKKDLDISMDKEDIENRVSHLKCAFTEFKEVKELSRERVLRNVKRITVNPDGSVSLVLTSGLSLKKSVVKYQIQDALY